MTTGMEVLDCLTEIFQGLLLHSLRTRPQPSERCPRLGELAPLLGTPRRRTFIPGPHRPLLKCQVPHVPRMHALLQKRNVLRTSRVHPEPGHETTQSARTDSP